MKIQIDFDNKVIRLENSVNLGEFIDKIKLMLSDWNSFQLETNVTINNWSNPIIIDRYPTTPYPWYSPFYGTSMLDTYCEVNGTFSADMFKSVANSGTQNFLLN